MGRSGGLHRSEFRTGNLINQELSLAHLLCLAREVIAKTHWAAVVGIGVV